MNFFLGGGGVFLTATCTKMFWDSPAAGCLDAFECAALQTVVFLQNVYGFVVDYSYYGMLAYIVLAGAAAAARAAAIDCCRDAWRWVDLSEGAKSSLFSRI